MQRSNKDTSAKETTSQTGETTPDLPGTPLDLHNIRGLIIDMDGVLYRGDEAMPGLVDFFATMEKLGLNYCLVTNNATRTPEQFSAKLKRLGVDVPPDHVLTSSGAAGRYVRAHAPNGTGFALVGEDSLRNAVLTANADRGFHDAGAAGTYVVAGLDQIGRAHV